MLTFDSPSSTSALTYIHLNLTEIVQGLMITLQYLQILLYRYGDCTMSTLFVNNLNTASGSTITVPTGKKLVVTDTGGLSVL